MTKNIIYPSYFNVNEAILQLFIGLFSTYSSPISLIFSNFSRTLANRRKDNVLAFKQVLYGTVKGLYVKDLVTSSLWTEKNWCADITIDMGNPAGVVRFTMLD